MHYNGAISFRQFLFSLKTCAVPLNLDVPSWNRRTAFEPINLATTRSVGTRRSRPPPEPPVITSEILEAKARARTLQAIRAARASVLARKTKAERCAVEQRARLLRTQLIARRRLYLNLARALADVSSHPFHFSFTFVPS